MKRKKSFEISEEMQNKIISVAYRDASLLDRIKVFRIVAKSDEARNLLNSYKITADKIKQIGEEKFPRELLKSVEHKTIPVEKITNTFMYDLFSVVLSRPVVSAAASVILIAAIITSVIINRPVQYNYNYSTAEVTEAEKQAKYAFSIVGKIFKETQTTLQKEVLGEAIAIPFHKSIRIVNNLLEGDKNETN